MLKVFKPKYGSKSDKFEIMYAKGRNKGNYKQIKLRKMRKIMLPQLIILITKNLFLKILNATIVVT